MGISIIATRDWGPNHTSLSKYLLARLNQLVDEEEVPTNRNPLTNGLILLEELYTVANLCIQRWKNSRRLESLLKECADDDLTTSVASDPIIQKFHRSTIREIRELAQQAIAPELARKVRDFCVIHISAIQPSYILNIRTELLAIDLVGGRFDVETSRINSLLGILVPQLIHEGHSVGYLQIPARVLARRELRVLVAELFNFFNLDSDRTYTCFLRLASQPEFLHDLGVQARSHLPERFRGEVPEPGFDGFELSISGKDPYSALIRSATKSFKGWSLRNPGSDPAALDAVWAEAFYERAGRYQKFDFASNSDPVVRTVRPNTFYETLRRLEVRIDSISDPILLELQETLYFYEQARSAPSIEVSFIMLWTALESLTGFRSERSDIEEIKLQFGPGLALGAVGRRVNSLVQRIRTTGNANEWRYLGPTASEFQEQGIYDWMVWLTDRTTQNTPQDPYEVLQHDPLVCKQYRDINERWTTLASLRSVIEKSKAATLYQIDRLYLTRNRLIHSGEFGHAGANQWIYLEWYVGKLLAVAVLTSNALARRLGVDVRTTLSASLQGQYQSTVDYLDRHRDHVVDIAHLQTSGLGRFPALCF